MSVKDLVANESVIRFNGYSPETPEEEQLLEEGGEYTVVEVDEGDDKVIVSIDNPSFNSKKRVSTNNPETVEVEVFSEEFAVVEEEPVKEKPATRRAKASTAKAPAAKPKAKAKTKAKSTKATSRKPAAKAAAAKAEEEAEEDNIPALINDEDPDIAELVAEAEDILELALELAEESAANDYRLGGVLYHVRLDKAYEELDERYQEKGGFQLYVKERLNIEYRKAMYLCSIYVAANTFGISSDKIAAMGWTKAAKISEVMTEENADDLVELAENNTVSDLAENIKVRYKEVGGTKGDKRKMTIFKFNSFEDQADAIKATLEGCALAMGFKGSRALSEAFEYIVVEWGAEHPLDPPAATRGRSVSAAGKGKRAAGRTGSKPSARRAAR